MKCVLLPGEYNTTKKWFLWMVDLRYFVRTLVNCSMCCPSCSIHLPILRRMFSCTALISPGSTAAKTSRIFCLSSSWFSGSGGKIVPHRELGRVTLGSTQGLDCRVRSICQGTYLSTKPSWQWQCRLDGHHAESTYCFGWRVADRRGACQASPEGTFGVRLHSVDG